MNARTHERTNLVATPLLVSPVGCGLRGPLFSTAGSEQAAPGCRPDSVLSGDLDIGISELGTREI